MPRQDSSYPYEASPSHNSQNAQGFAAPAESEYRPTGYAPVQFGDPGTGIQDTSQFYGQLMDSFGQPSAILCRMADAAFFYIDAHCPRSKGTGVMEPEKLFWDTAIINGHLDIEKLRALYNDIGALYDSASIPYTLDASKSPVLDRRGFLHLCVFELKADPDETHKAWNKKFNFQKLIDPMTNRPFPTPILRSAFPAFKESSAHSVVTSWATTAFIKFQRRQGEAQTAQLLASFRVPSFLKPGGFGIGQGSSYAHSDSQMLSMTEQIEKERKKTAMYNTASSVFNFLGGGRGGIRRPDISSLI
ncbi:hypothetical protein M422DRAFT_40710 [Sphaerobolus stellatus SS14]|nr:hypothetical protein M422DRAFT_40710 [Sphaerobolus stellatus SS14]